MSIKINLTPELWLLLNLALDNFIREFMTNAAGMSSEEIAAKTAVEEEKSKRMKEELTNA